MKLPIIGLNSVNKSAASVTAIANWLQSKHNYKVLEFANTSKRISRDLLSCLGYDVGESFELVTTNRHKKIDVLNCDGKKLCDTFDGLLRAHLLTNYDIMAMKNSIDLFNEKQAIIIKDVQSFSQARFIQDQGGFVIRVNETFSNGANDFLKDFKFNRFVLNDAGVAGLQKNIDLTIESLLEPLVSLCELR